MKNQVDCRRTYGFISKEKGTRRAVTWRCKDVINCSHCRGVEEWDVRRAMSQGKGELVQISADDWPAYQKKINRNSEDGYMKFPQPDGTILVRSNVLPSGKYKKVGSITTEQILATRLNGDFDGRIARTGIYAKEKKEKKAAEGGEIIKVTIFSPMFKYIDSGEIMPYADRDKSIETMSYRTSPYKKITKENAEDHHRYMTNFVIEAMSIVASSNVQPMIKKIILQVPEANFENWANGGMEVTGELNPLEETQEVMLDELFTGRRKPRNWINICIDNGWAVDSEDLKRRRETEKELFEEEKKMRTTWGMPCQH
jgi:hypothetical protein